MRTLTEDLLEERMLKEEAEHLAAEAKKARQRWEAAQHRVWMRMDAEHADGQRADGTNFVKASTPYAQVQDAGELARWAAENDPDLLDPAAKFHKDALNSLVARHREDGTPLPPGLGFYVKEYISHRKG